MSDQRSHTRRETLKILAAGSVAAPAVIASGERRKLRGAFTGPVRDVLATASGTIKGPYVENDFTYIIQSSNQAYPNSIRVLLPDNLDAVTTPKVVYVLPVNPDTRVQWNHGLLTFRTLNLHNRYNVIAVAPSFSDWPWYADNPTKSTVRQESYFIQDVVPFVDSLLSWMPMFENVSFAPDAKIVRLLLGFSKSGNGSYQLLLRYPDLFQAASIWDAPIMKLSPDQFEMPTIYGTQENFDGYAIPTLLQQRASLLTAKPPRLGLFGYGLFGGPKAIVDTSTGSPVDHIQKAHDYMNSLKVPHLFDSSVLREHRWDSGWMEQAMAALDTMSQG